jgi:death-on-curing protein
MRPTVYLTVDQVKEPHRDAIAQFGAADGIRSEQQLFSAIAQVQRSAFGRRRVSRYSEKAACGYFLSRNHPFIDGNKRVGLAAMLVFLELNGYEFDESEDERARMFEDISSGVVDQSEFFGWASNHVHPAGTLRAAKIESQAERSRLAG